jgi:hypothetical protein
MWSGNVPVFWGFVLANFCAMVMLSMMFLFFSFTLPDPTSPKERRKENCHANYTNEVVLISF